MISHSDESSIRSNRDRVRHVPNFVTSRTHNAASSNLEGVTADAGLSRESLYKALSGERNPSPDTVLRVVGALGLKLRAEAAFNAIATRLHYSTMSIGRAFNDLVDSGLAHTERDGKERHIRFKAEGRELFDAAHHLLRSPIRTEKFVRDGHIAPPLKHSGESALAELTDLSPPPLDAFAVAAGDWKTMAQTRGFVETGRGQAALIVETWAYDPAGLSAARTVDPLSLYAHFRNHRDERVSMAAERLLEEVAW